MNFSTLETAIVTGLPALMTDVSSTTQVIRSEVPRTITKQTVDVRLSFQGEEPAAGGGLGRPMTALLYRMSITSGSVSEIARKTWLQELRAALHNKRWPTSVTGLDHAEYRGGRLVPGEPGAGMPGTAGPARAEVDVAFVGDIHPDDLGS